jgi:hypothetical protein
MIPNTVVGTFTGTGAAINVVIGFKPDYIRIINVTDRDISHEWFRDIMADGTSVDDGAALATNAADGISAYAGTTGEGFTVGTDISESGKVYGYVAIRSGPGAQ